ncbi:MAG: sortase [Actinomycetota bacterium]
MSKLSRLRRFLVVSSMLGSALALVLAVVVLGGAIGPQPSEAAIRTIVAAPPPPAPPPAPAVEPLPAERSTKPRKPGPPIVQFGVIEIPRIGLVHPVYEGIQLRVIDRGPGHWPGTAMPGERGNAVFAGHRTTHSHPFLDIDLLVPGDQILFRTNAGVSTYEIREHLIVYPNDTWITNPTSAPTVTIFGCHPKRSARQRYVVRGSLVSHAPA